MSTARKKLRRIALTGGPAAGKTAVLDVLRRHLEGRLQVLPESATILFSGGFPRPREPKGLRLLQKSIYELQRSMEEIYALEAPAVPHICDRGSLDGAAYWPGGMERFLGAMGTTLESEYARYEAVLFLETSAYDENAYSVANPYRIETPARARQLDAKLQKVWRDHPHFYLISHEQRFYEKVVAVLIKLHDILGLDHGSSLAMPQMQQPVTHATKKRSPRKSQRGQRKGPKSAPQKRARKKRTN